MKTKVYPQRTDTKLEDPIQQFLLNAFLKYQKQYHRYHLNLGMSIQSDTRNTSLLNYKSIHEELYLHNPYS